MIKRIRRYAVFVGMIGLTALTSCKDDAVPQNFQPVSFKATVGPTEMPLTVNATDTLTLITLTNIPRSVDVTALKMTMTLPMGYSVSPDPTIARNFTSPVFFVVSSSTNRFRVKITIPPYDAATNPYGVYTPLDLNDIRNGLTANYKLMNDIVLPDMSLLGAIKTGINNYAAFGWYSIGGTYVNGPGNIVFSGTVDGNNFTIKNYNSQYRSDNDAPDFIKSTDRSGRSTDGLFGYAKNATFKNIGIELGLIGITSIKNDGTDALEANVR